MDVIPLEYCTRFVHFGYHADRQERGDLERALEAFKMAIDMGIQSKSQHDVTRAANHFNRVATKIKDNEEKLTLLEGKSLRLDT
jgi:hypothetical protein